MKLRADETATLVAVLDSDYEGPEDAAQAVWDAALVLLAKRDSWGVRGTFLGTEYAFGPYWGKAQAKAAARKVQLDPERAVCPLTRADFLDFESGRGDEQPASQWCEECQHPVFAHGYSDSSKHVGCVAGLVMTKAGKVTTPGCGCTAGRERRAA